MKLIKTLFVVSVLAIASQQTHAAIFNSGTINQTIADNNLTGFSTTLNVTSDITWIGDIRVTLNISGGFNGDLYAYLTHDGVTAILLNRIGTSSGDPFGNSSPGMNITLWSGAGEDIHIASSNLGPLTGLYQADGRNVSPLDLGAVNGATRDSTLQSFLGGSASGDWTLFIADVNGGGVSTLDSWSLEMGIAEVPEPVNVALGIFGGGFIVLQGMRYWKRKQIQV